MTRMKRVPEPDAASADERATLYGFRRNLVVAASAGTGKTHALVGVLVHLALGAAQNERGGLAEPVPLARIVATTFSRKAAAEIRARLVRELTRLASADPDAAYRSDVLLSCERSGAPRVSPDELSARARTALDGVVHARIGTLHGFAATIVHDYGLRAGWAPRFAIEPEEDTEVRAREAASAALEGLLAEDESGARSLARLAGGIAPLVERTAELLARLAEDGRDASSLDLATDDVRSIEANVDVLIAHARRLCADEALGPLATGLCNAWASADGERIENAASDLCAVAARGRAVEGAQAFFEFRAGLQGTTHAERGRNLVKLWRVRHRILPRAELFKTLLVRAETALRASMLRDSVLGYADVLRAARDILATEATAARDLGRDLDAFLIDEFQDTSRVQREIVELAWQDPGLAETVPGLPRIARVRRRGLLVVGDRKQSIYAFRGADVGSFAELCIGLAGQRAREALRIAPGRVWEPEEPIADFIALRENRRSAPEILSFVNAYSRIRLVASSEPAELYEVQYAPSIEDLGFAGDATWPEAGAPRVTWIRVPPARGAASSRVSEAEAIARRIGLMLDRGTPRVRGAPPRPRDIAVLAVRNAMLDATAYALARARIPYVVAGNGFFAAREVEDMLAMLAFVIDPEDVLARVSVLRGIWCGASDETLIALTDPHAGVTDVRSWGEGARRANVRPEDRPRLDALRDVILGLRGASASIGPAETLRQAARALDLEETLSLLPRGEQRVANVRKLVTLAEREPDARAFLARIHRASDEERPEPEAATFSEDDDAVRLLTVHASKGLDFPIVFVPEAGACSQGPERSPIVLGLGSERAALAMRALDDGGLPHETPAYARAQADAAHRELAEWARLAYVAATRAREAIVFVGDRRVPKGEATWTYRSTTAAALAALAEEAPGARLLTVEPDSILPVAPGTPARERPKPDVHHALAAPSSQTVALTTPELADFAVCPRRFQLARLIGLPEPGKDPKPAHGEVYAACAVREGAKVERDRVYLVRASSHDVSATIRGTIDLWVERADASTEAVLLATDPGEVSPRTSVVSELALLAEAGRTDHRTGALTRGRDDAPVWCSKPERAALQATEKRILAWVAACAHARWTGAFTRAPLSTCHAIGCGYVSLCHPRALQAG
jgi:ATP-dependent helicase/nuclease subunit A